MLSNQARELLTQGAEWRQEVHGVTAAGEPVILEYDGGAQTPRGYFTLIRSQEQLDATRGCFKQTHDAVVRCLKTLLVAPKLNKTIALPLDTGEKLTVRIDEFGNNELSPEWVLGCKAIH